MTTQRSLMLSALFLASMAWNWSVSAQNQDMEQWKHSTWRMALKLDTPNVVPPAVQWAILDKDPVVDFKARVKMMQDSYREQLVREAKTVKKEITRTGQKTVSWDLGFKDVTGDRVYLLTSAPDASHSFSSNGPDGQKWIVTKVVLIKGTPVCWCIPVEVKTGKEVHIKLTEKNTFDLESAFNKAMEES